MSEVLLPGAVALAAALALTPAVRAGARATGRIALPSGDRWHREPTALLGGLGIFGAFLAGTLAAALLAIAAGSELPLRQGAGILLAAGVMFAAGLADDILRLRPTTKLVLQALGGAVLVTGGVVYRLTGFEILDATLTVFWFMALTNAVNLIDNMDGVAAGVTTVAAGFLAALFALEGAWFLAALALALAGATGGFLPYNFRPASIFMGDSGSLVLGALLAALGAAYSGIAEARLPAAVVPVLVVIVPVLDTTLVSFTRTLARFPVTQGGRDHVSHRLVRMGFSEVGAALVLYGVAIAGGLAALGLREAAIYESLLVVVLFLAALGIFAAYLTRFHTYDASRVRAVSRRAILLEELFYRRRALEVVFDLAVFAVAYAGAYLLRYDAALPPEQVALLTATIALAVACKSVAFAAFGVYRGTWHQISVADVHRLLQAVLVGVLLTVCATVFLFREAQFSRSVFVLDGVLVALLAIGGRASFRSLDTFRSAFLNGAGARTLIYGAGRGGDLLLRELLANPERGYHVVGFVDDDPFKRGCALHGVPVLGSGPQLEWLLARYGVRSVLIGTTKLSAERLATVAELCRREEIELLQLEISLRAVTGAEPPAVPRVVGAVGAL